VQVLMVAGADVDTTHANGYTTLKEVAASRGHDAVVRALLGARADVKKTTRFGRAALVVASANGHKAIAQLPCDAGERRRVRSSGPRQTAALGAHGVARVGLPGLHAWLSSRVTNFMMQLRGSTLTPAQ
jgi:ankyrin repeat protein